MLQAFRMALASLWMGADEDCVVGVRTEQGAWKMQLEQAGCAIFVALREEVRDPEW